MFRGTGVAIVTPFTQMAVSTGHHLKRSSTTLLMASVNTLLC
jgi:hypothetical protein